MTTNSPLKNLFLTLYLLNNTFNENLFYDNETVREPSSDNSSNLNTLTTLTSPRSDEQGSPNIHQNLIRPLVQIPSTCDCYDFSGEIMNIVKPNLSKDCRNDSSTISNHQLMNRENIQYAKSFKNETIVNQKNYIIIIPSECTSTSNLGIVKQNYSQTLNQIAQGSKSAVDQLSQIIKTKMNSTKRVTVLSDECTSISNLNIVKQNYSQTLNQIAQGSKSAVDQLSQIIKTKMNSTKRETVLSDECTSISNLNIVKQNYSQTLNQIVEGSKSAGDQLSQIIKNKMNSTKRSTTLSNNGIQLTSSCPPTTFNSSNDTNTIFSLPQNVKSTTSKTINFTLANSGVSIMCSDLPKLFATLNHVSSTASILKNISGKFAGALDKLAPLTTIKLQTQKVEIPSSPKNADFTNIFRKNVTDSVNNNLNKSLVTTINTLNKLAEERQKYVNDTSLETTCMPLIKTSKPVTTNDKQNEIQTYSTSCNTIHAKITATTTRISTFSSLQNENLHDKNTHSTCMTSSALSCISILNITKLMPEIVNSPTTYQNRSEIDLRNTSMTKNRGTCDTVNVKPIHASATKSEPTVPLKCEGFEKDENISLTSENKREHNKEKDNNDCDSIRTESSNNERLTPKTHYSKRREKLTTQMITQKIFSPTLIDCSKQRNGSVVLIKLIAHRSEKPFDLEQLVHKIKIRRSNSRHHKLLHG